MIDRYGYPEMKALWEDKSKFDNFLKVELLICEGWHKLGRIPKEALDDIKANAKFDLKRVLEIEATTNHDVIAFVSAVAENVGENSRYIHLGVTSSDVIDTS